MNKRELAKKHEDFIAALFSGKRSASSGASIVDKGDVRVTDDQTLMECKYQGDPVTPPKSKSKIVRVLEKIAIEAYEEGKDPALALRYYDPDSTLANKTTGYVDVVVRLAGDDAYRSERLRVGTKIEIQRNN
jgi:hypothetical protein